MRGGSSFLYVAVCTIGESVMVKVGVSDHPERRFFSLQTHCPLPIQSLYVSEMRDRATAFAAEHEAHRRLSAYRTRGEWFQFHPKALDTMFAEVQGAVSPFKGSELQRLALYSTWD